jgi:hypothetical protein
MGRVSQQEKYACEAKRATLALPTEYGLYGLFGGGVIAYWQVPEYVRIWGVYGLYCQIVIT